jgi:phage terminase Nu1 subunit (DNA packaging protein)
MDDLPAPDGLQQRLSSKQLAWLLGVGPTRIAQLVAAGIAIKLGHDVYSVESVRRFIQSQRASGANGVSAFQTARTQLTRVRADIAELRRKELASEVLPRQEVADAGAMVCVAIRDAVLATPSKLARRLAVAANPSECERLMYDALAEALEQLSRLKVVGQSVSRRRQATNSDIDIAD